MNGFNPPPPGPDEPPPPYVESVPQHRPPTLSSSLQDVPNHEYTQGQQHSHHEPTPTGPSGALHLSSQPSNASHIFTYPLRIRPNSLRSEYPYPQEWAPARGVNIRDWSAFISVLIPDDAVTRDAKGLSPTRRRSIETIINQWNASFFLPRGVEMCLDEGHGAPLPQRGSPFPSAPPASGSTSYTPPPHSSRDRWTRKLKDIASQKDISVTADSIRMGDKFSLTPGALKIGKLALDERGINYAGRQIGPQIPPGSPSHAAQPYAQYSPFHRPAASFRTSQQSLPHPTVASIQQYAPPPGPPPPSRHHGQQQTGTTW